MAVENDVFLPDFVGVCPVDLLRDTLQFFLVYGIPAVGAALMATQALKILAAVSKLWAAGITVAWVVLVEGLQAAALAGVGCQVQAASRGALRLLFQLQEWLWFYGILFSCRSEK